MTMPTHPKKTYTPPRLRRYGDLRTLTEGTQKAKNEANNGANPGPKTRASTG
jgi:hypothetical protein